MYGNANENIKLKEEDEEFQDWHVSVQYDNSIVKVFCCPEDMMCTDIVRDSHSILECYESCDQS